MQVLLVDKNSVSDTVPVQCGVNLATAFNGGAKNLRSMWTVGLDSWLSL